MPDQKDIKLKVMGGEEVQPSGGAFQKKNNYQNNVNQHSFQDREERRRGDDINNRTLIPMGGPFSLTVVPNDGGCRIL